MRSRPLSLGLLLLLGGACSQIIGLGDYENTDAVDGNGGDGQTGGVGAKGGSGGVGAKGGRGGTNSGGGTNTGATAGEGGDGGMPGSSGAGPEGGVGPQGGVGNAGSGTGGAGGEGGEPGAAGGTSSGGTVGTGGSASGGTLNTGGTAGKAGTGGTTGGTGGKGGSGGTTGGAGGKGGATCTTSDMLLNNNPNFDASDAAPPDPAPWVQYSTQVTTSGTTVVINRQAFLSNAGVTAHTAKNAAWFGGVGSHYDFMDAVLDGFGEIYWLDLDLTIPVGTTQVTLSCYYQTQTDETTETIPDSRDVLIAWFWDYALNENAYEFQRWTPANSTPGWHLFTNTASGAAATALAGRALTLEFYSEVDSARASDFFIDTCTLKVTVCN